MEEPAEENLKWKSKMKVAVVLIVVLVLVSVGLAITLGVVISKSNPEPSSSASKESVEQAADICTTAGCTTSAAEILYAMDESVNPCEDFYEFSCGNWVRKNVIPESKSSYSRFGQLGEQVAAQLKALLEEPVTDEPQAVTESRKMYFACLDEESIEKLGYEPLTDAYDALGGFPMINETWEEGTFDYMDMLIDLRLYNNKYLFESLVYSDYKNSSKNLLQLKQQTLGLPSKEYYLDPRYSTELKAYREYIIGIGTFLNGSQASVEQDADDIIEFETYLANISQSKAETRDPAANYVKYTVAELYTNISSNFDWLRYINTLFSKVNYTFTSDSELIVHSTQFLIKMTDRVETTPKRILANYFMWRFTMNRISNLPKDIQDIESIYDKVVSGVSSRPPRWRKCVDYTDSFMGMAVGRLFVNTHFPVEAKAQVLDMILRLRVSFDELLESVTWLNDETKKLAIEKADSIQAQIGFPEWINNDTRLDEEYKGLSFESHTYFKNHLTTLNWLATAVLDSINYDVNRNSFGAAPATVNAYYQFTKNQIVFPAGILQQPFWHKDRPKSVNYGGIGVVIGHEITHGFDDTGRQFDHEGNLKQWWSTAVIERFNEAKQCIIDQYGRFVVPSLNRTLNGENTQGENIADNGGIKQSYKAFLKYQSQHGEGQRLPGLEKYSPNHLFFLGFAQSWCVNYNEQAIKSSLEAGVHSLSMFRVRGSLSNFPEFSKVFQCKLGSPMNPEKKCSVW